MRAYISLRSTARSFWLSACRAANSRLISSRGAANSRLLNRPSSYPDGVGAAAAGRQPQRQQRPDHPLASLTNLVSPARFQHRLQRRLVGPASFLCRPLCGSITGRLAGALCDKMLLRHFLQRRLFRPRGPAGAVLRRLAVRFLAPRCPGNRYPIGHNIIGRPVASLCLAWYIRRRRGAACHPGGPCLFASGLVASGLFARGRLGRRLCRLGCHLFIGGLDVTAGVTAGVTAMSGLLNAGTGFRTGFNTGIIVPVKLISRGMGIDWHNGSIICLRGMPHVVY